MSKFASHHTTPEAEFAPEPRDGLRNIPPYIPGSSVIKGFDNPVKLASNENAWGCSPEAMKAFHATVDSLFKYPDGGTRDLRQAISEKYSVRFENIMCGTGSDNLLELAAQGFLNPGDEAIYFKHSFAIYNIATRSAGGVPVEAEQGADLSLSVDAILKAVSAKTKIIFIANPDNPTGYILPFKEVERLISSVPARILVILDEAYYEFADDPAYKTGLELAEKYKNVLITRTFSKMFGMAGLRVGWGYASHEIMDVFARIRSPFNVSIPAQAAARAALKDEAWQENNIARNLSERKRIEAEYKKLGIKFIPSQANFTLLPFPDQETAEKLLNFFLSRGVIIRHMKSNDLPNCLRISVGTEEQNDILLKNLKDFYS